MIWIVKRIGAASQQTADPDGLSGTGGIAGGLFGCAFPAQPVDRGRTLKLVSVDTSRDQHMGFRHGRVKLDGVNLGAHGSPSSVFPADVTKSFSKSFARTLPCIVVTHSSPGRCSKT